MRFLPKLNHQYIGLALLAAANGLFYLNIAPIVNYSAALILLAFLPGRAWLPLFLQPATLPRAERFTLAVGLSLALIIFGAMLAVYLPGPISAAKLLVITNAVVLLGLITGRTESASNLNLHFAIRNSQLIIHN